MNSGNTYRMRPDGSHAEYFTHGQVNPFGLAFDPLGNLYSCDCHSRPVYQLLRGAWYPSFGKPHDGLGFGPEMVDVRPWLDGHRRHLLLRGRPVPRGLSRHDLRRQRRHQPDQPRQDRVARLDAQGHRAARLRLERGQLVPAGRHRARPRRCALRRRLLQPDHRPLRGAADPSRPRPDQRADLADRLPRAGRQAAAATGPGRSHEELGRAACRATSATPTWPCGSRRPISSSSAGARLRSASCGRRSRPSPRPAAGSMRSGCCNRLGQLDEASLLACATVGTDRELRVHA